MICILFFVLDDSIDFLKKLMLMPMDLLLLQSTAEGSFETWHHGGTWFISCLLFCYFMTPFAIDGLKKVTGRGLRNLMVIIYFVSSYIPIVIKVMEYESVYSSNIYRGAQFLLGMIIARLCLMNYFDRKENKSEKIFVVLLAILAIGITILDQVGGNYLYYNFFVILIFAGLIICGVLTTNGVFLKMLITFKPLEYFNSIAYEIFLSQFFCFKITNKIVRKYSGLDTSIIKTLIAAIICFGLAVILHEIVTKPCVTMLKRRNMRR